MIRHKGRWLLVVFLVVGLTGSASAQLEDNLSAYDEGTVEGYLKPFQEAVGQALNSNFFSTAAIAQTGIHARFEIRAMSVFFKDDDDTFTASTGGDFATPPLEAEASTVVGPGTSTRVVAPNGTAYVFPGGFDVSSLTLAVPQVSISGFRGTELTVRWLSVSTGDSEIGDFSTFGIGGRHNVSQYLVDFPVDVAGAIFYQTLGLENDLLDIKTFSIGIQGSKDFGIIRPLGSISFDTVSMSTTYASTAGEEPDINVDLESEKSLHLSAGAHLGLGGIGVTLTGELGSRTGVSASLGGGF